MEGTNVKPFCMLTTGRPARVIALAEAESFAKELESMGLNVGSDFIFFDGCNSI